MPFLVCAPTRLGPSGAGKSTLLNALACRMDKGATTEGKARLNRAPYGLNHLKRIARCGAAKRRLPEARRGLRERRLGAHAVALRAAPTPPRRGPLLLPAAVT